MAGETGDEQAGQVARADSGRWARGVSGNPAGRPKGSRNRTTALCAQLLGDHAEDIMGKLIERARKGDGIALKLCVDRLIPARAARDRTVDVELPDVAAVNDLVAAAAAVVDHAASGRITLSEAKEFMALLEGQRKLVETADLALRIEALEGRPAGGDAGAWAPEEAARHRVLPRQGGGGRE